MRSLKLIALSLIINIIFQLDCFSKALFGEITKEDFKIQAPQVLDAQTDIPITGAAVSIPSENLMDYTDNNGTFNLKSTKNSPVILSVQKEGYRPFSLTLKDGKIKDSLKLRLEKSNPNSIIISNNMMHLGDNSFSENSAGACLINSPCVGPSYSQKFEVKNITPKTKAYVTIGSVIGIDTIQAMKLGQNNLRNASSSPMEIFINNEKIGELKINGDNQKIPIPPNLLRKMASNTLTIKTGMNKSTTTNTDYDDVELMNLFVDIK